MLSGLTQPALSTESKVNHFPSLFFFVLQDNIWLFNVEPMGSKAPAAACSLSIHFLIAH